MRHGATEWSKDGRHTGRTDLPLLPEGEDEARALRPRIGDHAFARVLSSPSIRAHDTARLAGFGDRAETTDLLLELDYGEYEGITTAEIRRDRPDWDMYRDGCPGGETLEEIVSRMGRLLELIGEPEGDVLLFGHGHCFRALAVRYLGWKLIAASPMKLDSGSLSILGHDRERRALQLWNEHPPR